MEDINAGNGGVQSAITKEVRSRSRNFDRCVFIFESQSLNEEADSLAKFVNHLSPRHHMWLTAPSQCIFFSPLSLIEAQHGSKVT